MALRRNGSGGNGNFIAWLQTNLAELKRISAGQEHTLAELKKISAGHDAMFREHDAMFREHDAMFREHDAMLRDHDAMLRDHDALMREHDFRLGAHERGQLEARRQTREIVAEIARMDAARKRDSATLAHTLTGINVRVRRIERKKPR